jgi:XapX domain-containing protein
MKRSVCLQPRRAPKAGRNIVIAAGARPVPLDFPGAEHAITSDAFMELEDLPNRILMVGGGYIAAEFSHIAARLMGLVVGAAYGLLRSPVPPLIALVGLQQRLLERDEFG